MWYDKCLNWVSYNWITLPMKHTVNVKFSGVSFGMYCAGGLTLCNQLGLLRGRGGRRSSAFSLVMVRLYLFSLIWLPMTQLSTLLSTAWLCYLPFYIDLAEFNGWRISESVRQGTGICGRISTCLKSYFRCQLVKTVDIEKQCIFGIHPHGIVPFSGSVNIASEASSFSKLFPALTTRVLVAASSCFLVPGFRDLLLTHGTLDCSRFNCEKWLENGHSVFVFPGGAKEGLYSNPDIDWLDLSRRLGFIRLAIRYNIPVVPCYTFNEVDSFTQVSFSLLEQHYSLIHWFRQCFQRTFGIAAPLFCGLVPKRNTTSGGVTVVGKPIDLPVHSDEPSEKEVRLCLEIYINAVKALYAEHSAKYNSVHRELIIS